MNTDLDASRYRYAKDNFTAEFEGLLTKIIACYAIMLSDTVELANDENAIRDILLLNYLKNDNIRKQVRLQDFLFDREVQEDSTSGRTDIKIQTRNTFKRQDAYYIIECKRIDNTNLTGISGLNAEYIRNGIMRFVSQKYSCFYRVNGMIGFVVTQMNIADNIQNINFLLRNEFEEANIREYLTKKSCIKRFRHLYSSSHADIDNKLFVLYHLMFDFSSKMKY